MDNLHSLSDFQDFAAHRNVEDLPGVDDSPDPHDLEDLREKRSDNMMVIMTR
jgi:hypothetical protein